MRRGALRFAGSGLAVAAVVWFYYAAVPANSTTVALTLLLVVLGTSARWGLAEAILASVIGVAGLNYFFMPPVGTFTIEDPQNYVALFAFLVTAVTASQLSARARRRAAESEDRRHEVERLYTLVQGVMLSGNPRSTVREFVGRVVQIFGVKSAAFYSLAGGEILRAGAGSQAGSEHDLKVAAELQVPSHDPARDVVLAPVRMGARPVGGLVLAGGPPPVTVVRAIANLLAISMERARALEEAGHAEGVRQSEALKSAMLDALAHDFKTPLTVIKAAATGLLSQSTDPAGRELATIIDEEAGHLNQIAAEVISMARIEAGKLHLERRAVAVDEMVARAVVDVRAVSKGRTPQVEIAAGLPAVYADPEFIQQALKQLLDNALKYSPEDSPVRVTAAMRDGRIVIGVADRGPGIEENERSRIFEKFFRGRAHRFPVKGTGMGLSIAKGIVEAHRGKIWVESEPGQGAVFYFTLPAAGEGAA